MTSYAIISAIYTVILNCWVFIIEDKTKYEQRPFINSFLMVAFVLIVTFHPDYIRDASEYRTLFENSNIYLDSITHSSIFLHYYGFEYGFIFLCSIIKRIIPDVRVIYLLISIINVTLLPKYLRQITDDKCTEKIIRCIYITWYGFLYSAIAIRGGFAITLAVGGIAYFKNKKLARGALLFFIAFLFHRSVVFFVVIFGMSIIWFREADNRSRRTAFLFCVILFALLPLNIGARINELFQQTVFNVLTTLKLTSYFGSYVGSVNEVSLGLKQYLSCGAIVLTSYVIYKKKEIIINQFYLIIMPFAMFLIEVTVGMRASSRLYDMVLIMLIPLVGNIITNEYSNNTIKRYGMVINAAFCIIGFHTCYL